ADLYPAKEFPAAEERKTQAPTVSSQPAELQSYAGLYWSERLASPSRFAVVEGQLKFMTSEGPYRLVAIGPREFLLPVAPRRYTFTFEPGNGKRPARVVTRIEGQGQEQFVATTEPRPSAGDLAAFAGTYLSDELGTVWS